MPRAVEPRLSFDAERESPRFLVSIHIFNIIAAYLHEGTTTTIPETVENLVQCVKNGVGCSAWLFNDTCIDLSLQIPSDHSAHGRLAGLIHAIWEGDTILFPLLLRLEEHHFARFHGTISGLCDDDSAEAALITAYVPHQAYLASLVHAGVPLHAFETYALKEAFVTARGREEMRATREAQIMGAAQWAIRDAEGMCERLREQKNLVESVVAILRAPATKSSRQRERAEGKRDGLWAKVLRSVPSRSHNARRRFWGLSLPATGTQRPIKGELGTAFDEGWDDWKFVMVSFEAAAQCEQYGPICRWVAKSAKEAMATYDSAEEGGNPT